MNWSKVFYRLSAIVCTFLMLFSVLFTGRSNVITVYAEEGGHDPNSYVYFFNSGKWQEVGAYIYGDKGELLGGWGSTKAESADEIGEDWVKVGVSEEPPYSIIFYNTANDSKRAELYLSDAEHIYVTADGLSYASKDDAENNAPSYEEEDDENEDDGTVHETDVYFLNSKDWPDVRSYVYGNSGEALGSWPGQSVESASDFGEKWQKITVPAKTPFNIIFFNSENDSERTELQIPDDRHIYVTGGKAVYSSKGEAELAEGLADPSLMTTLYFYDYKNWGDISGYFFEKEDNDNPDSKSYVIGTDWPGAAAEKADDLGDSWYKISIPKNANEEFFWGVFTNGLDQTKDFFVNDKENIYIIPNGEKFSSKDLAEDAAKSLADEDDGCEEGPNSDIEKYKVSYKGEGVNLPYITYEAEFANTNAEILEKGTEYIKDIQSEASGRQAVKLNNSGDYVEFTLKEEANAIVLRYAMPDSSDGKGIDSKLKLTIGNDTKELDITSKHAWIYGSYPFNNVVSNGKPHRFYDETRLLLDKEYASGTKIKLEKTSDTDVDYVIVDFVEAELVPEKLRQPANSISVEEYGAIPNDSKNDYEAFVATIEAAKASGNTVWIPAGDFDLVEKKAIEASGVVIQGAGMWYTNLNGAGAAFKYGATSKFYDFAMTGISTVRNDKDDLAAFEGNSKKATNITIQNVWIEHTKVGVWSALTDRLVIQGCRIRNTYADGINLCSKTNDALIRNNNIRNTGDDGIAIWPWLGDCTNNTIEHNTVQVPTLANCIAIYGGNGNKVIANHVLDTINNGSGIVVGTEFDIKKDFSGTTLVDGNLLERTGSRQSDENYNIGSIWLWSSWNPMKADFMITNNKIIDAVHEGILLEANNVLDKVTIKNNSIIGADYAVEVFEPISNYGSGEGYAEVIDLKTSDLRNELIKNNNPNFVIDIKKSTIIDKIKDKISEVISVIDSTISSNKVNKSLNDDSKSGISDKAESASDNVRDAAASANSDGSRGDSIVKKSTVKSASAEEIENLSEEVVEDSQEKSNDQKNTDVSVANNSNELSGIVDEAVPAAGKSSDNQMFFIIGISAIAVLAIGTCALFLKRKMMKK